jgi:hypothetical protein
LQAEELPGVVMDDNFFSVAGKIYYTNNAAVSFDFLQSKVKQFCCNYHNEFHPDAVVCCTELL